MKRLLIHQQEYMQTKLKIELHLELKQDITLSF